MKPDGYSGKGLVDKLGYRAGDAVFTVTAPDWFAKELVGHDVSAVDSLPATWAHGFFRQQGEVEDFLGSLDFSSIEKGLWVSWPKKSSNLQTDLTEQTFRNMILPLGWVDTKVASIDETWSGLKFLRRKA